MGQGSEEHKGKPQHKIEAWCLQIMKCEPWGLEALSYEDWRTPAKCRDVHFAGGPLTKSLKRWTVLPTTQARLEGWGFLRQW